MTLELLTSAQSLSTRVQTVLEIFSYCDAMTSRAASQEKGFKDSLKIQMNHYLFQ